MFDALKGVASDLAVAAILAIVGWLWKLVNRWIKDIRRMQRGFVALYWRDRAIVDLTRKILHQLERQGRGDWHVLKQEADDLRDDLWRVDGNDSRPSEGRQRREWPGLESLREMMVRVEK